MAVYTHCTHLTRWCSGATNKFQNNFSSRFISFSRCCWCRCFFLLLIHFFVGTRFILENALQNANYSTRNSLYSFQTITAIVNFIIKKLLLCWLSATYSRAFSFKWIYFLSDPWHSPICYAVSSLRYSINRHWFNTFNNNALSTTNYWFKTFWLLDYTQTSFFHREKKRQFIYNSSILLQFFFSFIKPKKNDFFSSSICWARAYRMFNLF